MIEETPFFYTLALRLVLAGIICGILGLEREIRNKDAGLRTHILVGMGSALVMIVSQYGYQPSPENGIVLDPSRTAAQVVSGIGFLGAGLILVKQDFVRGLPPQQAYGYPPPSAWRQGRACCCYRFSPAFWL